MPGTCPKNVSRKLPGSNLGIFPGLAQNMLPGSFWEPTWKDFLARPRECFQETSQANFGFSMILHFGCLSVLLFVSITNLQRYLRFETKALEDIRDTYSKWKRLHFKLFSIQKYLVQARLSNF